MRYLSAVESIYRIFEKSLHFSSHNVENLPIHL